MMSSAAPIIKKILHAGQKYVPITDGSKVHFHFQTWKLGKERVLLDDSKKIGKREPMVLVIGHKFKLDVWEEIVKMMAVGEVASFQVKKERVYSYPFVSKTLRELGQERKVKHTCTMTLHTEGIGYSDLDDLINNPSDLEFIIESLSIQPLLQSTITGHRVFSEWENITLTKSRLAGFTYRDNYEELSGIFLTMFRQFPHNVFLHQILKVERSNEYEKELWQYSSEERLNLVPQLKEKGNNLYAQKLYDEAEDAYRQAIAICEQLMIRERKCDEEWISLNKLKLPVLLNYAQCKLVKGDYYPVIEHCNTVLDYDADNEKALYRRAKAHVGAWNPDAAEKDFKRLKTVNPSLSAIVDKELENIRNLRKEKEEQDKNALKKIFDKENKTS